eukprot:381746-Amphidinium_carterae.1
MFEHYENELSMISRLSLLDDDGFRCLPHTQPLPAHLHGVCLVAIPDWCLGTDITYAQALERARKAADGRMKDTQLKLLLR